MRAIPLLLFLVPYATAARPKLKDSHGVALVPLSDVENTPCSGSTYSGYGTVDGSLEKCDNHSAITLAAGKPKDALAYEEWKCTHLRLHGEMQGSKCGCKNNWKGAACELFIGCPEAAPYHYNTVCTPNPCQHDGQLAVGSQGIECTCNGQWDGRYCDRLACWRKVHKGQDKRWRIDKEKNDCVCGVHYSGDDCDKIIKCEKNGSLKEGFCVCKEGFGGELCEKKCKEGEVTCSAQSLFGSLLMAIVVFLGRI